MMDRILTNGPFTDKDIKRINNCRLYLLAITIADLSTVCGTQLNPFFINGETSILSSTTNWITTDQQKPGKLAWST
jgi:hypothetical protein